MVMIKLVRTDTTEASKINLGVGIHIFGRGSLLQCDDKRVSRKHGQLEVKERYLSIKALHHNPCFYTKDCNKDVKVLKHNEEIDLDTGDCFGLLPDKYWFEIIVCPESESDIQYKNINTVAPGSLCQTRGLNENNIDNETMYEDNYADTEATKHNDDPGSPSLISSENQLPNIDIAENLQSNMSNKNTTENSFHTTEGNERTSNASENQLPNIIELAKNLESNMSNENSTENSYHRIDEKERTSNASENQLPNIIDVAENLQSNMNNENTTENSFHSTDENESNNNDNVMNANDNESNNTENSNVEESKGTTKRSHSVDEDQPKRIKKEPLEIKQEPQPGPSDHNIEDTSPSKDSTLSPAHKPQQTVRERCYYGANCYRRNPTHLSQFSHPRDSDWGSSDKGICPYGAKCLKPDLRHWALHQHPPGISPPPPRQAIQIQRRDKTIYIYARTVNVYDDYLHAEDSDGSVDLDFDF
ncbi:aprataxin and PNK-like factor isoform X2 [Leptidea sinapis]|uniref:aprataxin and PNK-like factor isoform X2 n=1 Tax=Leptidea sinapis TaxID=189913 RepID=UPI002136303D|nr:aprataxin and PNK-like factor isoform X2 [Leptidea sinapis]